MLLQTFVDGVELEQKKTVPTVFVGMSYPVFRNFYISMEAGPAFINSDVYLGIKPGVRYFLDMEQRISVALSLTHIFEADHSDDGVFWICQFRIDLQGILTSVMSLIQGVVYLWLLIFNAISRE